MSAIGSKNSPEPKRYDLLPFAKLMLGFINESKQTANIPITKGKSEYIQRSPSILIIGMACELL